MGCDIHSYVEIRNGGRWEWARGLFAADAELPWEADYPFADRSYGLFGFLADVRNYSPSPVIAEPRGLPDDVSAELSTEHEEFGGGHSTSWLTVAEMLAYDYDRTFWDRRYIDDETSLREFLGPSYFRRLDDLAKLGDPADVRVVFWFDN